MYKKGKLIYEGKAKKIYTVEGDESLIWQEFKNSLTAFNAQKKGEFDGKGAINKKIASIIYKKLEAEGVKTHWVKDINETEIVTKKLTMIPIEVVVRNWLAGSTAKKFEIPEGTVLDKPLVEFYYKKDELNDPFISDDQALMLKAAKDEDELLQLKIMALKIDSILINIFFKCGIQLVDFKLEFGKDEKGRLMLADEISPDSCRLWDLDTHEKLDKDRFRRDLGKVDEKYREVLSRLEAQSL